jgi:hypothetical protein
MANKDLFEQAIAEAKSVREAAIANAKEALEETLTPHLKDMLAAKLQEMDDSSTDEEVVKEIEGDVEEGMDKDNKDEAIEETFTEEEEVEDAEEADIDSEESEEEAEEEEVEVKDMEVADLKDLIRDIISQEMGAEGEEEIPGQELPVDDMIGAEDEEEIDLDELLKEITEMNYEEDSNEAEVPATEEVLNEVDPVTVGAGVAALFGAGAGITHLMDKLEAGEFGEKGKKLALGLRKAGSTAANIREEEIDEVRPGYGVGEFGDPMENDLVKAVMFLAKHAKKAGKKVGDFVKDIEIGKMSDAMKEIELEETSELEEAMTTIEELKGQLQEVNLLNAKLLYVNKVFKSSSLTESQKVSVIAAFDKAETVKEVKLVFETVSDNVVGKTTKSTIKEARLGMASKATGTTASKPEVISEVSDAVKRMQKLAGIIK